MQRRYDAGIVKQEELGAVYPDRDFLKEKYGYRYSAITTTAGCPFNCEFCCVPLFQSKKYLHRNPEDIWNEFEMIQGQYRGLVLTDENLYGFKPDAVAHSRNTFQGLVDRGIYQNFFGFTSLNIHKDPVVLKSMHDAGCVGLLLGIESVDDYALKKMQKGLNAKIDYEQCMKDIHRHGIAVWGAFVFGTDQDRYPDTFKNVVDFVLTEGVDIFTCGILAPLGETNLRKRLMADNRIFRIRQPEDWKYYTAHHLTYLLRGTTLDELIEGMEYVEKHLFSLEVLRERFKRSQEELQDPNSAMFAFRVNLDWRHVMAHLVQNLRDLRDSGDYERYYREHQRLQTATEPVKGVV